MEVDERKEAGMRHRVRVREMGRWIEMEKGVGRMREGSHVNGEEEVGRSGREGERSGKRE